MSGGLSTLPYHCPRKKRCCGVPLGARLLRLAVHPEGKTAAVQHHTIPRKRAPLGKGPHTASRSIDR